MQKKLSERLIDAACIFFDVQEDYFKQKTREASDKKAILFFLLNKEGEVSLNEISRLFDHAKSSVFESVEKIETQRNIYRTVSEQIKAIIKIAGNLNAKMICVDMKIITDVD